VIFHYCGLRERGGFRATEGRSGSGYFALAIVFGNGQCRVKVALGEFLVSKTLFPTSFSAGPHQRVTGKKAVIRTFPQENLLSNPER